MFALTTCKPWVESVLLWKVNMTMQLVSWHLVFVVCGFVLNPLRAFLYSMVMIVAVVCFIVFVAIIIKFICTVICNGNATSDNLAVNNTFHCVDLVVMLSLTMLLICAYAYIVFVLHISITVSNQTVDEIIKSIIPNAFLIINAWLLPKMFLDPKKILKYIKKNGRYQK